jgi:periplasmic protein TonB
MSDHVREVRVPIARKLGAAVLSTLFVVATAAGQIAESDYDVPPRPLKMTRPTYPSAAFARRVQGTVVIEFTIDEKGRVRDAVIVDSIPELDKAALETVKKWRFSPARKDGRAVATRARAPVSFRVTDSKENK